jgi:transcriptional regulator with XRE-family HTH domain
VKLTLEQIRSKVGLTQVELANALRINQSGLSKLERRPDMYVSMLRSFIQAVGGHLELRAIFPNGEVLEVSGLEGRGTFEDLKDLVHKTCQILPIPPGLDYNKFLLMSADESVATFQKLSNQQYLDIPTRRISEVLPGTSGALPVVMLKGSLAWSGQKRLWQFRPVALGQES